MIEERRNMLSTDSLTHSNAICITTNGSIKKDRTLVMGAGIAGSLKKEFPGIDSVFAQKIAKFGHKTLLITQVNIRSPQKCNIVSLPTKPGTQHTFISEYQVMNRYKDNVRYPMQGWMYKSSLSLITKSARELVNLTDKHKWTRVLLPRPGCSNGGLQWNIVKEQISFLDNRFIICSL